jgi:hypothetical protein
LLPWRKESVGGKFERSCEPHLVRTRDGADRPRKIL